MNSQLTIDYSRITNDRGRGFVVTVTIQTGKWARQYGGQDNVQVSLAEGAIVSDALQEAQIPLEKIGVILKNGKPVSKTASLHDNDKLELLQLILGG